MPLFRGGAIALAAILLAACSSGSQSSGGGAAAQSATISFAAPTNGSQVTIPFDIQLESSVPLGEPESGNHHAHLYFDTNTNAADYDIVYSNSWQVTRSLAPGEHTIIVALANPNHSLVGPTQTINVMVGEASGSGGSGGSGESPLPSVAPSVSAPTY